MAELAYNNNSDTVENFLQLMLESILEEGTLLLLRFYIDKLVTGCCSA